MRNSTSIAAMMITICLVLLGVCVSFAEERVPMTNELLEKLLKAEFGDEQVDGRPGAWQIDLSEEDEELEDEGDDEGEDLGCQPRAIEDADEAVEDDEEKGEKDNPAPSDDEKEDGGGEADEDELFELDKEEQAPAVMLVLTDSNADRMRLMMPIRKFDPTTKRKDLQLALIALHSNFDRALDARYATQNDILWSVFIHPLESLTAKDLKNGLDQVRTLRKTTGTTYTSSELLFGGAGLNAP